MTEIFKVQKRAEAIIQSCINLTQIEVAERYVRNMFKLYNEKEFRKVLGKDEAKDFRKAMKDEMLKKLILKKETLQLKLK
jgi:hypothetical protein